MILGTTGVTLAILLGFTALAVDIANGYVARSILQHAVDDGAVTAQRWSAQVDDPGADPGAVEAQAVAAALDSARRDIAAQGLAGVTAVEAAVAGPRLRIAARASIRTWFLRPFGITTLAPSASSDTALWTALPGGAPVVPAAPGPAPAVALPEAPGGSGAAGQSGDVAGTGDLSGSAGGEIAEGP